MKPPEFSNPNASRDQPVPEKQKPAIILEKDAASTSSNANALKLKAVPSEKTVRRSKTHCCCGLVGVENGSILIAIIELLVLSQVVVAFLIYHAKGQERYETENALLAEVVHYDILMPTLLFNLVCISSIFLLLLGLMLRKPLFLLPHLFFQGVSIAYNLTACAICTANAVRLSSSEPLIILAITGYVCFTLLQVQFIAVVFAAYKSVNFSNVSVLSQGHFQTYAVNQRIAYVHYES